MNKEQTRRLKPHEIADIKENIPDFISIEDRIEYDKNGNAKQMFILKKKYSSLEQKELECIEKYGLKLVSFLWSYGDTYIDFERPEYIENEINR